MSIYAIFVAYVLAVCAIGFGIAALDLLVGWLADGSDVRERP